MKNKLLPTDWSAKSESQNGSQRPSSTPFIVQNWYNKGGLNKGRAEKLFGCLVQKS